MICIIISLFLSFYATSIEHVYESFLNDSSLPKSSNNFPTCKFSTMTAKLMEFLSIVSRAFEMVPFLRQTLTFSIFCTRTAKWREVELLCLLQIWFIHALFVDEIFKAFVSLGTCCNMNRWERTGLSHLPALEGSIFGGDTVRVNKAHLASGVRGSRWSQTNCVYVGCTILDKYIKHFLFDLMNAK